MIKLQHHLVLNILKQIRVWTIKNELDDDNPNRFLITATFKQTPFKIKQKLCDIACTRNSAAKCEGIKKKSTRNYYQKSDFPLLNSYF